MRAQLLLRLTLTHLVMLVAARDCECGFSVNSTSDPQHQVFTEYVENDFTERSLHGWIPQEYAINKSTARGPFGKNASLNNVVLSEEGMQLWVRPAINEMIPMAEVTSKRTDMLYGSFRMRAKMGTANGTCGAMFWGKYHNNTQEIDMEFLSKQFDESDGSNINLVIQSPASQEAGFDARYTPGFTLHHLPFRPDSDFHDYRFDWTPDEVAFYADNQLLYVMTESIPNSPGWMVFNHWSNGDPGWSAGPPVQHTKMVISHAHFYFNSSESSVQKKHIKRCKEWDPSKICTIPGDIKIHLMPQEEGEKGSYLSPDTTDPESTTSSTSSANKPDHVSLGATDHSATIYAIIGVVVGLVIIIFVGCMVTVRYWVTLRAKLTRVFNGRKHRSGQVIELKDSSTDEEKLARTPDTGLERPQRQSSLLRVLDWQRLEEDEESILAEEVAQSLMYEPVSWRRHGTA